MQKIQLFRTVALVVNVLIWQPWSVYIDYVQQTWRPGDWLTARPLTLSLKWGSQTVQVLALLL